MRIVRAELRRYRLPMRKELRTAVGTVVGREGFELLFETDDGAVGIGEGAPAYWLGGESLEWTGRVLERFVTRLGAAGESGLDAQRLAEVLSCATSDMRGREGAAVSELRRGHSAAALCAVDTALLDLRGRGRGSRVCELLSTDPAATCKLARLLTHYDPERLIDEVGVAVQAGVDTVKLKAGRVAVADDIARVESIRALRQPQLRLRIDANRAWSFADACAFLTAIGPCGVDYVEEPLAAANAESLARLKAATDVPIAVDESLADREVLTALACRSSCDVVVLKTARLGGPTRAVELARAASDYGFRVVFTDSIEGPVGRAATIHAACACAPLLEPIGLGGAVLLLDGSRGGERIEASTAALGPGLGVDGVALKAGLP